MLDIKPSLQRPSKSTKTTSNNKAPAPPPSMILKADSSTTYPSSYDVFYRCSDFQPHDAPEEAPRWRVNLGRKDRGVEMVKGLVQLVEGETFGS